MEESGALAGGFPGGHFFFSLLQDFGGGIEQEDEVGFGQERVAEFDEELRRAEAVAFLVHEEIKVVAVDQHETAAKNDRENALAPAEEKFEPVEGEIGERGDGVS